MTISPLDIRRQEFNRRMRGYDPDDVRAYLEVVARGVEELTDEGRRRDEKIRELETKLVHYERVEDALQEAVHTARESSRQALATAEARAEQLRMEAERAGDEIRREAEQENLRLRQETQAIAGRRKEIVARLRSFLISEMEMLAHYEGADPVGFIKLMPATGAGDLPPAAAPRYLDAGGERAGRAPAPEAFAPDAAPDDDRAAPAFAAPEAPPPAGAPAPADVPATPAALASGDEDVDDAAPVPTDAPAAEPVHAPEPGEAPVPAPNAAPPTIEETIRIAEGPSAAAGAPPGAAPTVEAPLAAHRVFPAPAVRTATMGAAPEVGPPPVVTDAPVAAGAAPAPEPASDADARARAGEGTTPWATPVLERRDAYPPAALPPSPGGPAEGGAERAPADARGYTHQPLFGPETGGPGEPRNLSASAEEIERIRRLLSGLD